MENNTLVTTEAENFLKAIGLEGTVTTIDTEDGYEVAIETPDTALLIGKHGNTLSSFEYLLTQMVAAKTEEFKRVIVEVGGYREERESYLQDLSMRLKEEVVATGIDKTIRGLKAWERRHVHMLLSEDNDVVTESEGEGRDRVLVIKKK